MNPIELGKFIANLRNEKNLTQEELAEKLFIDKRKISRWECGNSIPDFETLIKLTEILDVSLYELSICQRVKDEAISERILNKLKSIKDLKKLKRKKIFYIVIVILLGIFFAFTTIYTLNNYGTVEIYRFESLDENFAIEGNYIHAKNQNIINVSNINFHKKDILLNKQVLTCEIFDGDDRVINITIDNGSFNRDSYSSFMRNINNPIHNDILLFRIKHINEKSEKNVYDFNFKLTKKYDNKLF